MAYNGLLDGGLVVMAGCAADWTGGTNISSLAHGLEWETVLDGGIGGGSFWIEVDDPFNVAAYSWLMHGKRINVSHTYDATTRYTYKAYIVNDPRRGLAGEKSRVTVELGGPLEVAKWRTDAAFSFTDCDTEACWFPNKRNNKVFSCETGDSIEISVDKGDKVPDNWRGGLISYLPYLGAQYMIGSSGVNKLSGVKRLDGHVTTRLGDSMKASVMIPATRTRGYNDTRYVNGTYWDIIKTWSGNNTNRYFDSNSWGVSWGTDGVKHLALALYSQPVTGANNVMNADRMVRFDEVRVYTGTLAKRLDEGMETVADWVNLHTTVDTDAIYSIVPNLVARPYCSPIDAMSEWALQGNKIVMWGWWPDRATNNVEYRAVYLPTAGVRTSGDCYSVDATAHGVQWEVRPRPEDGQGEVRALRVIYGRKGRNTDWPAGQPNAVIGPADPGFRNTGGPFQGATSIVPTVDFSGKNWTTQHAKDIAKSLGRRLQNADKMAGTVTARDVVLERTSDSAEMPYAYLQAGDFLVCDQEDVNSTKPMVITRCHVDVDGRQVNIEVGLPADKLLRQFEQAGSLRKANLRRR